jgi:hypothetical protein
VPLSESSRRNAARIVDEHFNFIKEECDSGKVNYNKYFLLHLGVGRDSHSKDSQTGQRRDSVGSDNAVYGKRKGK